MRSTWKLGFQYIRTRSVSHLMLAVSYMTNLTEIIKKNMLMEGLLTFVRVTSKDNKLLD